MTPDDDAFPTVQSSAVPPDDAAVAALWARHRAGDRAAYETLVELHLPLVKTVVGRVAMHLPAHVSREDLQAAGAMGLVSALERYDPAREARFATYATIRIRGAVLDELRAHDFLGRGVRERAQRVERAVAELRGRHEDLDPEAIAAEAGLTLDEYWEAEMGVQASRRVSLNAPTHPGGGEDGRSTLAERMADARGPAPGARLEMAELMKLVIDQLTPKERRLVVLYYDEGLTLKEVGQVMGVTESRVSQMHTEMVSRLRRRLEGMGIYG